MTENLQHHPANRNFAGEAPLADLLPHVFSLDGLRDRKGRRRINLVQDERLRERLFEHWQQQKAHMELMLKDLMTHIRVLQPQAMQETHVLVVQVRLVL